MEETASPTARDERRSPTPAAAHKREAIRTVKEALSEGRLILHYQPIVGARDGRIGCVEALLRWKGPPAGGELADLVRLAERSPVIFRLQDWTLREACRAAAGWRERGLTGLRVNVNVSARVLPRARLAGRLRREMRSAGLPSGTLALEITETSGIDDFAEVAGHLDELIAMGAEMWLDDFGTGHSSLEWLSHLPVHGVKIAGTFVKRLPDPRCRAIVTRVVEMARDLGLRVAAEGVESAEQRDFLVERGCDLLQGFLFHASMPADELPGTLAGQPTLESAP